MIIYNYDPTTLEFKFKGEAAKSPLDDEFLIPAFATTIEPPRVKAGYARCFISRKWEYIEDHRGKKIYSTDYAIETTILNLGPIPEGYTTLIPCEAPKWDGTKWIVDPRKPKEYVDNRYDEYPNLHEVLEALIEKYEEGRPEKMDEIISRRNIVKAKYPKK